jgi:hypothetical protein
MRVLLVSEGKHERSGALEALVRRMNGTFAEVHQDRLANGDIHVIHGKGRGYFKKALRWIGEARKRGYHALVLVVDEDGNPDRVGEIDEAQDNTLFPLPRALGVAVRMFDAWILADERALTDVLGYTVGRQKNPETIADPKAECANLLSRTKINITQAQMYAAVAEKANPDVVSNRCPKGFAPFAGRVRRLSDTA